MFSLLSRNNALITTVNASSARKARTDKWLRYYFDQQSPDTVAFMAQQWEDVRNFRVFQINVVKKIVNKRANLYRLAPRRTFQGIDQRAAEDLYRIAAADVVLKKCSRLVKLLKSCLLQVGYADGGPTLNLITPNILDVVAADPAKPTEIIVTHRASRPQDVTYSHWTASTYRRLDYRGQPLAVPGNPDGVNPYGLLPFVPLFDALPDDQFFLPGGDDLIEAQEAVNVALSNLWRSVELQAHGQPWATGVPYGSEYGGKAPLGPSRILYLPDNGKFGFAAPNSPIREILEAIEFVLRQTAATNDLSADVFDLDRRSESGAAKHVEQIDLREARQDDVALWRTYEARLFEVLKHVVNTHAAGTFPDQAGVSIDFAELQESLTETERLTNGRTKVELGVWSPVDLLRSEDPDGYPTRDDAMRELLRRKDETTQVTLVD